MLPLMCSFSLPVPVVEMAVLWSGPSSVLELLLTILESDTEDDMASEPESPAAESDREVLSDRDPVKEAKLDQEHSEEDNYKETMRGVRSFISWHQIPDFGNSSSSMDDNSFAGSRTQPTGKVSIKLPADDWLCRKLEKLNLTIAEGYPSRNAEIAVL